MSCSQTRQRQKVVDFTRRVSNGERLFSLSPFSVVGMVARVEGEITIPMLREALHKARIRHPLLGARIVWDPQGDPWFTTEGAGDIPGEVVQRASADQWIELVVRERQVPFHFGERPPVRIFLIQSDAVCEMIILCHHIICDGLSLAFLARDLLTYLGEPDLPVDQTLAPVPVDADSLPSDLSLNKVASYFVDRINRKWQVEKETFGQQDYVSLCEAYWRQFDHQCLSVELSKVETDELVARCRRNQVTVNSALTSAFAGARATVLASEVQNPKVAVAVNLRGRLDGPVGEAMGFYAGAPTLRCRYRAKQVFWANARRYQKAIRSRLGDKQVLQDFLTWSHLDPTILEAVNFKKLGHLIAQGQASYDRLRAFASRDDVVTRILKRDGQLALDRVAIGTAITNLTRLEFAIAYGPLRLDRLMMVPGGAFPLVNCGLVLGAVTCAGKLSLTIGYAEQAVSTPTMAQIRDLAMAWLSR